MIGQGPMMASDANNPQFLGAHNPDMAVVVKFYSKAVHQPYASAEAGRPIYLDVDFVQIFTPGNQLNIVDTPVRIEHKQRFAQQWAQYQSGKGTGMEMGTPVNQWTFLSAAQAEEFRGLKFFTVEQIANASDGQLQSLGMVGGMSPMSVRARAQAFLGQAAQGAPAEKQAQENAELKAKLEAMEKQIQAMIGAGMEAPKEKRKRRTKAEMEADHSGQPEVVNPEAATEQV